METASRDLANIANNIAKEVNAAAITEGQRLLSRAESAKLELTASQRLGSYILFVRNI
jgi:hypothetical protein